MLESIFQLLDEWIDEQNAEARRGGIALIKKCEFKIVGQIALFEAKLDLNIAMTQDFDAFTNARPAVIEKLNDLLKANGLVYDLLSDEIWMPEETQYVELYQGDWALVQRAEPEYVMVSKAKWASAKNKLLLREYIGSNPPQIFFELCSKYGADLEPLLKDSFSE